MSKIKSTKQFKEQVEPRSRRCRRATRRRRAALGLVRVEPLGLKLKAKAA